jgi:hypothetical protein
MYTAGATVLLLLLIMTLGTIYFQMAKRRAILLALRKPIRVTMRKAPAIILPLLSTIAHLRFYIPIISLFNVPAAFFMGFCAKFAKRNSFFLHERFSHDHAPSFYHEIHAL